MYQIRLYRRGHFPCIYYLIEFEVNFKTRTKPYDNELKSSKKHTKGKLPNINKRNLNDCM